MQAQKKRTSLRASILLLVFSCGVLPILVIVGILGMITNRNAYNHVTEVIGVSIDSTMDTLRRDLDNVVSAALGASYVPTVRTAYAAWQRDDDEKRLYNAVYGFLSDHYSHNSQLRGAYVLFVDEALEGRFYVANPNLGDYAAVEAFYTDGVSEEISAMLPGMGTEVEFLHRDGRLYLVRALSLVGARYQNYAALVLEIHQPLLFESVESLPWVRAANISIGGQPIVFDAQGLAPGGFVGDEALRTQRTPEGLLVEGIADSGRYPLRFAVLADTGPLLATNRGSLVQLVLLALLCVPLAFILYGFFRKKINKPLRELAGLANKIEQGDFGAQIDLDRLNSAETYGLGVCMNAMSAQIEDQFEHIYREELALRDAEIKALQSQINPHFLGNTLEMINWQARLEGGAATSRMLEALSTMLEGALDRKKRPVIHLSEEMMYVDSYLYIIRERLGRRLVVEKRVDASLLDRLVPRLILQPIVENAVEHGLAGRQKGSITIRAVEESGGWMRLEVENDSPLSPGDEARIARLLEGVPEEESALNVGIRNVHARLRLLYGPESGLTVKTTKMGTTISSMRIHNDEKTQG